METGTAVTTIKYCNVAIPPDPTETKIMASTPMMIPQNIRNGAGGLSVPVITIEIVYVMESPVVATNIVVSTRNKKEIIKPAGNCCVIASKAAGISEPAYGIEITPGLAISKARPEPPTIVNQNIVTIGAPMDTEKIISRIFRPLDILAINIAISGP